MSDPNNPFAFYHTIKEIYAALGVKPLRGSIVERLASLPPQEELCMCEDCYPGAKAANESKERAKIPAEIEPTSLIPYALVQDELEPIPVGLAANPGALSRDIENHRILVRKDCIEDMRIDCAQHPPCPDDNPFISCTLEHDQEALQEIIRAKDEKGNIYSAKWHDGENEYRTVEVVDPDMKKQLLKLVDVQFSEELAERSRVKEKHVETAVENAGPEEGGNRSQREYIWQELETIWQNVRDEEAKKNHQVPRRKAFRKLTETEIYGALGLQISGGWTHCGIFPSDPETLLLMKPLPEKAKNLLKQATAVAVKESRLSINKSTRKNSENEISLSQTNKNNNCKGISCSTNSIPLLQIPQKDQQPQPYRPTTATTAAPSDWQPSLMDTSRTEISRTVEAIDARKTEEPRVGGPAMNNSTAIGGAVGQRRRQTLPVLPEEGLFAVEGGKERGREDGQIIRRGAKRGLADDKTEGSADKRFRGTLLF